MIQFMIDHYRARFPNCKIVIYDSGSTDNTLEIAKKNKCEILHFSHAGGFVEKRHTEIKNTCWKNANSDWVLNCDLDDLLDIDEKSLKNEEAKGTTIISTEGYDMIDMENKLNIAGMKYGARNPGCDKSYLFNKKFIREINYGSGTHTCNPAGIVKYSKTKYKLFHYCYINFDVTVERYRVFKARNNPNDRENAGYYSETPKQIEDIYRETRRSAVLIRS